MHPVIAFEKLYFFFFENFGNLNLTETVVR
jgi:hypothetical protein